MVRNTTPTPLQCLTHCAESSRRRELSAQCVRHCRGVGVVFLTIAKALKDATELEGWTGGANSVPEWAAQGEFRGPPGPMSWPHLGRSRPAELARSVTLIS